eukprot:8256458-Alexandrium_andersonii.AAC.1
MGQPRPAGGCAGARGSHPGRYRTCARKAGRFTSPEGCPRAVKHKVCARTQDSMPALDNRPKTHMHAGTSGKTCADTTPQARTQSSRVLATGH